MTWIKEIDKHCNGIKYYLKVQSSLNTLTDKHDCNGVK